MKEFSYILCTLSLTLLMANVSFAKIEISPLPNSQSLTENQIIASKIFTSFLKCDNQKYQEMIKCRNSFFANSVSKAQKENYSQITRVAHKFSELLFAMKVKSR